MINIWDHKKGSVNTVEHLMKNTMTGNVFDGTPSPPTPKIMKYVQTAIRPYQRCERRTWRGSSRRGLVGEQEREKDVSGLRELVRHAKNRCGGCRLGQHQRLGQTMQRQKHQY